MSSNKSKQKKQAQKIAKEKAKIIRKYVPALSKIDLRKQLTPSQKGLVTKAFSEYEKLTKRPVKIFRSKNIAKLKTAQQVSQHSGNIKFNVAFVPSATKDAKIAVKDDKLVIRSKYVDEIHIEFNMRSLAQNPTKEIQRIIDKYPEFTSFVLMAGESIWNGPIHRDLASEKMAQLMHRYDDGGIKLKTDRSNHYTKWAVGMRGYSAKNQRDIQGHVADYRKKNKKILDEKRKARKAKKAREIYRGK